MTQPTVVFVPGLRDHVADHWQTLMQERLDNAVCVPRLGKTVLARAAWVAALQSTLSNISGPVILVAHSAGAMIVAHWAKWHRAPILGALLATPPDFQTPLPPGYPTLDQLADNGWMPVPRQPLSFPSIVAASTNDPIARYERVALLAADWGSRLVDVGAVGHLNAASGFGEWAQGLALVEELGLRTPATAR
jgi:predicted alpha/beta hydrolase family esterase